MKVAVAGKPHDKRAVVMSSEADSRTTRIVPTGVSFQRTYQLRDPAWDSLLASAPGSHFEQTSGWGAVKAGYGWQVFRILAAVAGRLVGGVQVLVRRLVLLAGSVTSLAGQWRSLDMTGW